ncbi:MAG: signal peptidase II, partial [Candidatus Omnitrophica bacterium]|nr:signal peptidase II [Candidatus Omnitrophota bacterium]
MYKVSGRRRKIHRLIKLYYLIILLIYLLDQFSKFYILKVVQQGSSTPVINNILHITLVQNTGAAFGMLKEHPSLFIVIAIIAVFLIVFFLLKKSHALNTPEKIALSFILGGTLGNLTDRVRFGYVIDFIDLRVWPVFNIADSFITI